MTRNNNRTTGPRKKGQVCFAVEECDQVKIIAHGLCDRHYRMQRIYGRTERITRRHGEGTMHEDGYPIITVEGRQRMAHIVHAEKALGKPLPPKAIVHHITEREDDYLGPFKLIICPDQAYHMLIHKLMRRKGISFRWGWPNGPVGDEG